MLRDGNRHGVYELEVDVLPEGELAASYHPPDNSSIVPTDTVKNTIHVLANDALKTCRTSFANVLGNLFLNQYAHLSGVHVEIRERRWDRMEVRGQPHDHAFVAEGNGQWFARCDFQRDAPSILRAGLRDHLVMKTTGSGFVGYNVCELTTLPPTENRILATRLSAEWEFAGNADDFASVDVKFINAAYSVFAERYSPSVQRTLLEIGESILEACGEVSRVALKMPNVHFLDIDLSRFRGSDPTTVFLPTDEPHGEIEAVIQR
ncbi:MAG: urate oxidase [Verrucomicrobia bacterium]|nr:urate oxidase [Verrucomicrobiota bacterium]